MDEEIKNPEILQLQEQINAMKQSIAELTNSHNKMYDYLKDKSTQGEEVKRDNKKNVSLKEFINGKDNNR